jgi:hypothetical protein
LKPFLILDKFFSQGFNLMGCNMAIKKSVFFEISGFNENLKMNEDVGISYILRKIGKVKFDFNFKAKTSGRRFFKGLIFGILNYVLTTLCRWFSKNQQISTFLSPEKRKCFLGKLFILFIFLSFLTFFFFPIFSLKKFLLKIY